MTVFGKPVSAYVSFAAPILFLVTAVGAVRLLLSLGGTPFSTTRWVSMNLAMLVAVLYFGIRTHTTGFGSYKNILPCTFLTAILFHGVAIAGILIGVATGQDNAFTVPEAYFGNPDGKSLSHAGAHLVVGIPAVSIIAWLQASLVLFITRKVSRRAA